MQVYFKVQCRIVGIFQGTMQDCRYTFNLQCRTVGILQDRMQDCWYTSRHNVGFKVYFKAQYKIEGKLLGTIQDCGYQCPEEHITWHHDEDELGRHREPQDPGCKESFPKLHKNVSIRRPLAFKKNGNFPYSNNLG